MAEIDTLAPCPGNCDKRCFNERLWRIYKQLVLQGPERKGRETYINLLELETVWKACQQSREEIRGK